MRLNLKLREKSTMVGRIDESMAGKFRSYLRNKGYSVTPQRERVLREIARMGDHFDAEELVGKLRRRQEPVSRATVYRTINHLEQSGIIRKLDLDEAHAHYENTVGTRHHEHLICRKCGRITEVTDTALERRIQHVARTNGFTLEKHTVQLIGLCGDCRRR